LTEDRSAGWTRRYDQCLRYVEGVLRTVDSGKSVPLGPSPAPLEPPPPAPASAAPQPPRVAYCAPHPDDESLSGALALRLRLETGAPVASVAITLGSDAGQRARRLRELESACRVLGFDLVVPLPPSGFDGVNLEERRDHPERWAEKVEALREIFDRLKPDWVFAPHAEDFNTTHIGTHFLVVEALGAHLVRSGRGPVTFVQTEFWHQLAEPNLMLGVSTEVVAIQSMAAMEHGGEMARNPYHLLMPARLMDNVRRGSEVVGGQGAAAQAFAFAELYRVTFMRGKDVVSPRPGGVILGPADKIHPASLQAKFLPGGK
jgi:LmbE family N-acetylglucosaminyl deacetylase